ncbi:cell wall teichoic acid glycosylation protein GtcA, partial [Listeria monocytogenes]|nr:cell wall teichoic acid glycosylation protein GtcA [Listeria monocytogenes]EBD1660480.1 cell wall teichoic acid glycosylation protein GtcA [Listeria monocytogenes]
MNQKFHIERSYFMSKIRQLLNKIPWYTDQVH